MAKEVKKETKKAIKKETKKKEVKKVSKPKEPFFASVKKELKLVKWPSFKDIVKYTLATIIFVVLFIAFFEILNLIMAYIKGVFN